MWVVVRVDMQIKSSADGAAEGRLNSTQVFSPMKYLRILNSGDLLQLDTGKEPTSNDDN